MNCNFCLSKNIEQVYTPAKSKIDLHVNICKDCGLVFSSYDSKRYEDSNITKSNPKFSHLSCEADYSDIRVGKQQMTKYIFDTLDKINLPNSINKVLDIRSARGHFVLKALEYFNVDSIDCIEEDDYMTVTYDNNPSINIWRGKYYNLNTEYIYDLIYSCHTLEHYSNPSKVLQYIKSRLNKDGLFYIDVPNNENINHNHNIDEFFYDKHLFYHNDDVLSSYIESLGFELLHKNTTPQNIGLLFKNSNIKKEYPKYNLYRYNTELINNYKENITTNRSILVEKQEQLNNNFPKGKCNVVFGGGRPLDAFVKYGNLNLDNFDYLVDDYLSQVTNTLYNKKLYNSSVLNTLKPDNILLLVKHPSPELINFLTKNNPNVNIIYLSKWLIK
jgi:SAM-dependent methyltransferase